MSSKKLLIVDDEPGIRESLKDYFEFEGYEAKISSCGEEALAFTENEQFDLIISDIRMPRGDGKYLVTKLNERNTDSPPVILMSGFSDLSLEEAYHIGALGIVPKPFQPRELLLLVESTIKRQEFEKLYPVRRTEVLITSASLHSAILEKKLNCGKSGFFISAGSQIPSVGEAITISFHDVNLRAEGLVRWIRSYEHAGKARGFGVEIFKTSDHLKEAVRRFVAENKVASTIPMSLKD